MRYKAITYSSLFLILIMSFSCKEKQEQASNVLVQIGTETLYARDIKSLLPEGLSPEDSAIVVQEYIRSWIDNQLLFIEAQKLLKDTLDINKKTKAYRKQLFVYEYTKQILNETLDTLVSITEMKDYYNNNLEKYLLNEPVIKAHYMTMSSEAMGYYIERDMIKTTPLENIDKVIEYCNGTGREIHIIEEWIRLSTLQKTIHCMNIINDESLKTTKYYECFNDDLRYLLIIDEVTSIGNQAPFEFLTPIIREVIINQRMNEKMNLYKQDLFLHAKSNGTVVINN